MKIFNTLNKIIALILFVIIFLSTSHAKPLDKFDKADRVSNYFSGILLLNKNQYDESLKFFKKLDGLEKRHLNYSIKYLYTLVNSGNLKEAFHYSKKLEKQKLDIFESQLVLGVYYLKNSNLKFANKHFLKAREKNSRFILNKYVANSLYHWSNLSDSNINRTSIEFDKLDKRFENLQKIQKVFLNCFFNSEETNKLFKKLTSDKKTDFSRYNYFYASYLVSKEKKEDAINVVKSSLVSYPRNLLLNQYIKDLEENKNLSSFNCNKEEHVIAEILYITANALSSQSIFPLSNFYLNLAKFLNEDFHSYETLLAENYYKTDNYERARKVYINLSKKGEAYQWFSSKQISRIYLQKDNKQRALKLLGDAYNSLIKKNIYETFDYAEFLKNNEKFEESIPYYSKIIRDVKIDHPLYAEATDGRGVAYERIGEWNKAEKDLLASLKANPEQAYVINYLAYSWIEQGVKIQKSLKMLEKANKLKSNDPYITDSLGWALYKLKRYKSQKIIYN